MCSARGLVRAALGASASTSLVALPSTCGIALAADEQAGHLSKARHKFEYNYNYMNDTKNIEEKKPNSSKHRGVNKKHTHMLRCLLFKPDRLCSSCDGTRMMGFSKIAAKHLHKKFGLERRTSRADYRLYGLYIAVWSVQLSYTCDGKAADQRRASENLWLKQTKNVVRFLQEDSLGKPGPRADIGCSWASRIPPLARHDLWLLPVACGLLKRGIKKRSKRSTHSNLNQRRQNYEPCRRVPQR